jgi:hypothetical protein
MNLRSFSIRIIIFISSFLFFMIPLNNAQEHSSYGYGAEPDFYIIVTIPLTVNVFSFLGTLYIFYRK